MFYTTSYCNITIEKRSNLWCRSFSVPNIRRLYGSEGSEVEEKRQLLDFVFQNLEMKDKKLSVTLREPFKMIKDASLLGKRPRICPG